MEYAFDISGRNDNYIRHVGYNDDNEYINAFFNKDTVRLISFKITELLQGVHPENRPIVVPDCNISSIMSSVYKSYTPQTGDIYSRYIVENGMSSDNYIQSLIDQTIEIITSYVKNTMEMDENNKKLTIWTTVYGDFNRHGLQQTSKIKIRNKHPAYGQIHMHY
jgi:hypothetical protein